jgi:uncharacterized protein (DUF2236 family)
MQPTFFVNENSIARKIWGKADTILFIFAGAAAEFALSKAVDWLYFTGKLPQDPIGRLFSTVSYARTIVFSKTETAHRAIDAMASIHAGIEKSRGASIPDWAYRDVLFMLIDYSIRAYEVLEHELSLSEKEEVFHVFARMGSRMGVTGLPDTFAGYLLMRQLHLHQNLKRSSYTDDLYRQYKKHLGVVRYRILLEVQHLVAPENVRERLGFHRKSFLNPILTLYNMSKFLRIDPLIRYLILPAQYRAQIKALDQ